MSPERKRPLFRLVTVVLPHLVFWCWNAVFLAVAAFGITPLVTASLVAELLGDGRTWGLCAAAILVILVPLAATLLGALALRRDPARLFRLFYAVEAPLFLLALGRLFLVRDLTPGVGYVIAATVLAVSAHVYRLLRGAEETRPWAVLLTLAGDTLGVWVAGYVAAFLFFFAVPLGWQSGVTILRLRWIAELARMFVHSAGEATVVILGGTLLLFSGIVFGSLPPVLIALYAGRFRAGMRWAASRLGVARAVLAVTVVSTALAGGFLASVRQPQRAAFALLAEPPADDAARVARLAAAGDLRDGLLNAYLARFRYLGSITDADLVREMWRELLGVGKPGQERVQHAFNVVASPFLFDGPFDSKMEGNGAGEAYKAFFDRSIQRGEREAVVTAVEATWSREEREAGLLSAGGRKVHVEAQEARLVDQHGDLAEIEIHETYLNRSSDPQEVLYYFSLPETAALTGLWLGDTDDRGAAFAFSVSPRGAAQRVYRGEVQRRRDPALLEQVGPRQYRLRAFPVPPATSTTSRGRRLPDVTPARPLHLWMRYRALATAGGFPLPHLLEERNAYRDRSTRRTLSGHPISLDASTWLPPVLPASEDHTPHRHAFRIRNDVLVVAAPEPAPAALPAGKRFALVLDRSYSMTPHAAEAAAALDRLRGALAPANELHLYLTSAPLRGEPPRRLDDASAFDPRSVVYYGGQDPAELLVQLDALRGDTRYDGIVVLTDEGGLDLAGPKREPKDLGAPVWMIHLGGTLAPAYDDATLETIQRRGGGAVTTADEALTKLAAGPGDADLGWADGYRFRLGGEGEAEDPGPLGRSFAPLAVRRYLPGAARAPGVAGLDDVHKLAVEHAVVTPYSSMIVLVDEAQRAALREAEKSEDRFDRAVETGEARLSAPSPALSGVTGTPEPEEWVLLALGALGLASAARKRLSASIHR